MKKNKFVEKMVRSLVNDPKSTTEIFVGLSNAFAYGDIFTAAEINCSNTQLTALFDSFDALIKTSKEIRANN